MEQLKTKYLGHVSIQTSDVFSFPFGLPGFTEETAFIIMDLPGNSLFQILQSVHTPDLAFIITDPHRFYPDYEFELDSSVVEQLELTGKQDVALAVIVTLKDPFRTSTMNLKAPLILNTRMYKGKQYILQQTGHSVQTSLLTLDTPDAKGE